MGGDWSHLCRHVLSRLPACRLAYPQVHHRDLQLSVRRDARHASGVTADEHVQSGGRGGPRDRWGVLGEVQVSRGGRLRSGVGGRWRAAKETHVAEPQVLYRGGRGEEGVGQGIKQ